MKSRPNKERIMERKLCLKKFLVILVISLIVASPVNAQKPTIADDNWTEETFDEAYGAPTNLITKTWYESDGTGYVFKANKTFSMTFTATLRDYDLEYTINVPGTWKRDKTNLSFTCNFAKTYVTYDKSSVAKLPMRRQELVKKELANKTNEFKKSDPSITTDKYQILRLEEDILVLGIKNDYYRGGYKPKVLSPSE